MRRVEVKRARVPPTVDVVHILQTTNHKTYLHSQLVISKNTHTHKTWAALLLHVSIFTVSMLA